MNINGIDLIASLGTLAIFYAMYRVLNSNIWENLENNYDEENNEKKETYSIKSKNKS